MYLVYILCLSHYKVSCRLVYFKYIILYVPNYCNNVPTKKLSLQLTCFCLQNLSSSPMIWWLYFSFDNSKWSLCSEATKLLMEAEFYLFHSLILSFLSTARLFLAKLYSDMNTVGLLCYGMCVCVFYKCFLWSTDFKYLQISVVLYCSLRPV